ncbi:type II secretion system major pseudopilin GspG [Algimonas porphyrae]|uniref:Type II secretion system core protein G n=1 Tax=Algimonas porphyrae TaxID=1128113 RepID=A0ABQ5V4S0_9PROT|nr:type II secretion system major pseudopilin GspG [Algimonas porphyrae]GLQ21665.1 type II secretion system protein GspG [Algimonas porphyrae]
MAIHSRPQRTPRTGEDGFTLTEVLVTMAIIGLLATGVVLAVLPRLGDASITKARADIASYETALEFYRLDHFRYPSEQEGLEALVEAPSTVDADKYPAEGYIQQLRDDPWNNPYIYRNPGENGPIDILSYGADGQEGGEGADADIGNWQ